MLILPKCPECGADAHKGAPFTIKAWTVQKAVDRGLDPERTSHNAYDCGSCGHDFPALTFTRETFRTPTVNVFDATGKAWDIEAEWSDRVSDWQSPIPLPRGVTKIVDVSANFR